MAKRASRITVVDTDGRIEVSIVVKSAPGRLTRDELTHSTRTVANNIADSLKGTPHFRVGADNTRVTV